MSHMTFAVTVTKPQPASHNLRLIAVTCGEFSMIDAVLHCLDCIGPARISDTNAELFGKTAKKLPGRAQWHEARGLPL